jgi:class 3 adenylate cyclase/tetratricopeptide (TPR) repeat protein
MKCSNCQATLPDTAKFCSNCGAPLSTVQTQVGERKLVTVLFADVVGSTAMGERIDPEDITEIMNGAFALMNDAVAHHQGMVARLMGDAILAFFGVPVARENDAERAVRAGLEICTTAGNYADQIRARHEVDFQVRVGINTGLVVMDIVGNQVRSEFTAMGDAVNLSSRLQNAASPGSVLISHGTYRHVRGLFQVKPLEPIHAKGKSDPVQVYQVSGVRERNDHQLTRAVAGIKTPLVGRESELNQLKDNYQALRGEKQTSAKIVTITGDAGVGKSRLLYEFTHWLDLQPENLQVFRARSNEEMAHLPYSLLRELFTSKFGIQDNDSETEAKQKFAEGIGKFTGKGQADWIPIIGHLIGFNYTNDPHLEGILDESQQIRERAFNGAVQILRNILKNNPILILLEDIQWADEGSLDFVRYLVKECQNHPLLVVCLARKTLFEQNPTWGEDLPGHTRINLGPLSASDSQKLVSEILRKVSDIPPALHDLIIQRAEGNPFYVEEAIKMLIDDGVIIPSNDRWEIRQDQIVEGKIPSTLIGLLQARLDSLPQQERLVLHRASVAGRVFWGELAARMDDANEGGEAVSGMNTHSALGNLQRRELIYMVDPSTFSGTSEYIFKHALLREVTYERILKRLRRIYHLQVAEWLCECSGEQVGIYAGRIGEHFAYAGEALKAAEWYQRAGKYCQDTYIPEMAKDYYQKALALWEQAGDSNRRSQQAEVYYGLGEVLNWLGRYDDAVHAYQNMTRLAKAEADIRQQSRAWHGTAEAQMQRGDTRAAILSASQAESLAGKANAKLELIKALWMKAWGAYHLGEMENALQIAKQVSELSHQLEDRGQMAHSLNLLGVLESAAGHYQEATQHFEQALEIFTALGNRRRAMPLMNNLGVIREARGDYPGALTEYQAALDVAREIGNRDGEMVYLSNLGQVRVRMKEYAAAETDLRQVIEMAGSTGLHVLSTTYSFLAKSCLGQNKPEDAKAAAQQAFFLAEKNESQEDIGLAWRALGHVAAAFGEAIPIRTNYKEQPHLFRADNCFRESERIFKEIEREDERARTLRAWATFEMRQGDQKLGLKMWEEARVIFSQLGALAEVQQMEEYHEQ